jgi:hypothetical protein
VKRYPRGAGAERHRRSLSAKTRDLSNILEFGVTASKTAIYPSMAQRHMCSSMGALRRPLTAEAISAQRFTSRAFHSSARRFEEQPSDATPGLRMFPRPSVAKRGTVLTCNQRQILAKPAPRPPSSRSPNFNHSVKSSYLAHSHADPSEKAKWHDAALPHLSKSTNPGSYQKTTTCPPTPSQT